MKKTVMAAVLALTMVACGGADLCPAKPVCPNDPTPTADQVKQCQDGIKDGATCGKELKAILDCAARNRTCGSDGKTDQNSINSACALYPFIYLSCASKADAGM